MLLKIKNRLIILSMLPTKGNIKNMTIAEDIKKKISLTQEEMTAVDFIYENDNYKWSSESDNGKEVEFTDMEKELIRGQINELDQNQSVTTDILEIYQLFK